MLEAVIPAIEARYPALRAREERFLIGFSKSGWGALSLIMRHSDVFERAVAGTPPLPCRNRPAGGCARSWARKPTFSDTRS